MPNALRQNAMASAGAAVAAISGADVEIAATATAMSADVARRRPPDGARARPAADRPVRHRTSWQDARVGTRRAASSRRRRALVRAVARVARRPQPLAAWYVWVDGAAAVVHEGAEQQLPGLRDAGQVERLAAQQGQGQPAGHRPGARGRARAGDGGVRGGGRGAARRAAERARR